MYMYIYIYHQDEYYVHLPLPVSVLLPSSSQCTLAFSKAEETAPSNMVSMTYDQKNVLNSCTNSHM